MNLLSHSKSNSNLFSEDSAGSSEAGERQFIWVVGFRDYL